MPSPYAAGSNPPPARRCGRETWRWPVLSGCCICVTRPRHGLCAKRDTLGDLSPLGNGDTRTLGEVPRFAQPFSQESTPDPFLPLSMLSAAHADHRAHPSCMGTRSTVAARTKPRPARTAEGSATSMKQPPQRRMAHHAEGRPRSRIIATHEMSVRNTGNGRQELSAHPTHDHRKSQWPTQPSRQSQTVIHHATQSA